MAETFRAIVLEEHDGQVTASLQQVPRDRLPEGDVLVRVAYSGVNYKDGLAMTGNKNKVVRSFPMVPGIDLVGTVAASSAPEFTPGDRVVLTGWGVGERHWGGFAQLARVKAEWLVPIPRRFSLQEAAAIGTAGVTAMLAIDTLERHGLLPQEPHEILVTGASGGVGSFAVALFSSLGYHVAAATGRTAAHDYLRELGARTIVGREELTAPGGPLGSARWGGAVDTVGGETLAGVLRTLAYGASVAACGNAGGIPFATTILPFILRGVNLLGVDSLPVPRERRERLWARIEQALLQDALEHITTRVAPLAEAPALGRQIVEGGGFQGRVVIDVNA
ncbi:MAG TPA: MDR family oxidoreductase [Ktedonobacterales bacterium]|nr:MDR family oxidoreductase [Ktedonobacterales bacterium]